MNRPMPTHEGERLTHSVAGVGSPYQGFGNTAPHSFYKGKRSAGIDGYSLFRIAVSGWAWIRFSTRSDNPVATVNDYALNPYTENFIRLPNCVKFCSVFVNTAGQSIWIQRVEE